LNGQLHIITIDAWLSSMLWVCLCITQYIHHIPVPQIQELVHHPRLMMLYTHWSQYWSHQLRIPGHLIIFPHLPMSLSVSLASLSSLPTKKTLLPWSLQNPQSQDPVEDQCSQLEGGLFR
jgi:hypothetical protein